MAEESATKASAKVGNQHPAPHRIDVEKESFKPRSGRGSKVFTDGFKIPGFSAYTDLPGKVCVECNFAAMKFSSQCPKCGGELRPE
ncbi:MAG: hypothetical protein ACT4OM_04470 [Actinomycetota bacterium]